ncbi:hypothetical protein RUM43_002555 [Polyplax serrata]|uniref:TAFH domain-containing protein n=1 Tax=Polyplax serrata TaxID=468196 RepID=A0AAN8NTM4_POLSC
MASEQFLEEALSTDVDESAVNALVGSLETQLVPPTSVQSNTDGTVVQNHVNNSISNGGIVQKHGVSNEESEGSVSNAGGVVPDGSSNTKQTLVRSTSLAHSTVVNTVVTSLSGLPISQIGPNVITKSSEGVKIVTYPAGNQLGSPQVVNINNRVSFPQTITLPNGSIPSSVISSVPSNVQTIVTNSPLNKSIPGAINVIKVDQGQPSGATLVIKAPGSGPMTAGSMTLTQGTPGTTAAPGIVTLAKPLMAGQPVGNTVQILNVNAVRPGTPIQGQKGLPQHRVVINSPQVISRPGAPAQPTQITLSPLQGLQPGGSGHILVKSESGQLQLIRIGPAPTATPGATTGTITSNNASQFRIQSLPVQQGSGSTAAVVIATSSAGAVQSSQPPGLTAAAPKQQMDTTKEKCRKFLANLLELSSREPKAVERNVRTLIQELIDAKVEPEDFCDRLEKLLNASPQPCLIGFLKKSLPLLRQSLFSREMTIEGIRPPPQQVVNTSSVAQVPQIQTQMRPQMVTQTVRVVAPLNAAGQNISVTTPRMGTLQNRFVTPLRGQLPAQGKIIATSIRGQTPLATSTQPPPLHHTTPVSSQTSSPVHQIRASTPTRIVTPKNQTNKAPIKQVITKATIQTKANATNSRSINVISKPSTPSIVNKSISKVVYKGGYEELKFGASSFGGDDDINDVAAMGGVNLAEESQRILGSTQFVGTQIRSVKDEIFLHSVPLQNKIRQIVSNHGLDEPSSEVASLVSHACQERLKTLIEKLACIAEHRIDVIKLDSRYEVTQDVKGQLKFLEELDKVERKRHEEQERELLLRAAKSRSKSEDPEQVKLKAKAKEMQRAEMEELRQREANLTALQAIGPRKKPRLDGAGQSDAGSGGNGSGSIFGRPHLPLKPRLKRVNLKDLLFLLEQEKETSKTNLLYKAYLK